MSALMRLNLLCSRIAGHPKCAGLKEPYASTRLYGSVRGAISDGRPYRDSYQLAGRVSNDKRARVSGQSLERSGLIGS